MRLYKPKVGILGRYASIGLAGLVGMLGGCKSSQIGAMYSFNDVNKMSVAGREDDKCFVGGTKDEDGNIEGKLQIPIEDIEKFRYNYLEFEGSKSEEESLDQNIENQSYSGSASLAFHSIGCTDFYTFLNINGSLDEESTTTSCDDVSYKIDKNVKNVGARIDFFPYNEKWRAEIGYNFGKEEIKEEIKSPIISDSTSYDSKYQQIFFGGEYNVESGSRVKRLESNVGARVVYSYSEEEVEPSLEGNVWGVYGLSENVVFGAYFSSTDNKGNEFSLMLSKSNIEKRRVTNLRDRLRFRSGDLDNLLNTFELIEKDNFTGIKDSNINSNHFTFTLGEEYKRFAVGGEYLFPSVVNNGVGVCYEFFVKYDDIEEDISIGGFGGFLSTF